jgi:translation initiation factor 2 alpha subunit (eIF-2alpha)
MSFDSTNMDNNNTTEGNDNNSNCRTERYYKNPFPQINDFVMTKVIDLNQEGSNLELPEYNYLNGYVTINELAHKKGRKRQQIIFRIRINDLIPMRVINVDANKNLVLVSRRNIKEEEANAFKEKFRYASQNNKICDEINALYRNYIKTNLMGANNDFARAILWNMYEQLQESDSEDDLINQQNIFKKVYSQILCNPMCVLVQYEDNFKERMMNNFLNRITFKHYSFETELIITTIKGIDTLKKILNLIDTLNVNGVKVATVANSPKYRIIVEGTDSQLLQDLVTDMLNNMKKLSADNEVQLTVNYANKPSKDYSNEDMIQIKYLSTNEINDLFSK